MKKGRLEAFGDVFLTIVIALFETKGGRFPVTVRRPQDKLEYKCKNKQINIGIC